ncbi:MAG: glycine cleavage system aminomethyltransferase GcvT [Chloroflexota bacterium]
MKRTPFYHQIVAAGATIQVAQGWEVAAEFTGERAEHLAVRERAGLFDWSSTGEIEIQGRDALALVQRVIVNDAAQMPIGRVLYSTMCKPDGAILSDLTVYRLGENRYWVMTAWGSNAAQQRVEFDWIVDAAKGLDVSVTDVSSGVALLALQGPRARDILAPLTSANLGALSYMNSVETTLADIPRALISRTGYTGELGYELIIAAEHAHELWDALIAAGQKYGMVLVGQKAAFSLRIEKGYIMRFDFMDNVTPLEAGLGWTVKFDKGDFIGHDALWRQKQAGITRALVSIEMLDDGLPAIGSRIVKNGKVIGKITSSAYGHTIGRPLALGLAPIEDAQPGVQITVETEGKSHSARLARRPVYDLENTRIRT